MKKTLTTAQKVQAHRATAAATTSKGLAKASTFEEKARDAGASALARISSDGRVVVLTATKVTPERSASVELHFDTVSGAFVYGPSQAKINGNFRKVRNASEALRLLG
jgi:hypothetical protein